MGEVHWERVGRVAEVQVWIERAEVRMANSVRLIGAKRVRANMSVTVARGDGVATASC